MATSLVLVIKAGHSAPKNLFSSGSPHASINSLANYLIATAGGTENASIDCQASTTAPAAASATATFASVVATNTIVIGGVTLTAVTSGSNGTSQFTVGVSNTADAASLAATINANTTLSPVLTATAASGVVTITSLTKGSLANLVTLTASATITLSSPTLAGGTGGAQGAVSTFRMGL